jgi:hypothetical protein
MVAIRRIFDESDDSIGPVVAGLDSSVIIKNCCPERGFNWSLPADQTFRTGFPQLDAGALGAAVQTCAFSQVVSGHLDRNLVFLSGM